MKLDLFTHLGEEEITGEELARKLDADPRAVCMLADAFTAMLSIKHTPVERKNNNIFCCHLCSFSLPFKIITLDNLMFGSMATAHIFVVGVIDNG